MNNPEQNLITPLHVSMAVSASQAIRLAKQELQEWKIDKFIITGLSKRGWSSWLTTISDNNIVTVIPFVIDLLNTQESLENMYFSYGKNWLVAFYPYYKRDIDKTIKTPEFMKLMQIEDPLKYLDSHYQNRLAIPKYIINASGDDFYVPDNPKFYYDKLPGEKSLRIVPNTDHYGIKEFTDETIIPFLIRFQNNDKTPELTETLTGNTLSVYFSEEPVKIIRWTATNPITRDFRYTCDIKYIPSVVRSVSAEKVEITLENETSGWQATFLEATFEDGYIATSQVYITPDEYPMSTPPANGATCQTLPGRGLGN